MSILFRLAKGIKLLFLVIPMCYTVSGQDQGMNVIDMSDLKGHIYFLASDELSGRATVDPSIHIAAKYIAGELKKMGIQPIDDDRDYFQMYALNEIEYDMDNTMIKMQGNHPGRVINEEPFYLFPFPEEDLDISGEVVFAGYGISSPGDGFDEFAEVDVAGKVAIIMDGGPTDGAGNSRIDGVAMSGYFRFFSKLMTAQSAGAKAVLFVYPPKSEYSNLFDEYPMYKSFLGGTTSLEGDSGGQMSMIPGVTTKLIFVGREVVDQLLNDSGMTLDELQKNIDRNLEPRSFIISNKTININVRLKESRIKVPNVIGFIEGSDPELKEEVILYSAHFDHIGAKDRNDIFNGADDNASGTTALLELAEAYQSLKQKPKRSILLLWVSGEEIGLYGSRYYSDNPLVPLEKTLVDINLDMIGRVRTEADSAKPGMITERGEVFVIGGHQSTELLEINNRIFERMNLIPDYTLGDLNHPERLYYRSDHINFAQKDIPCLFITTGLHSDYHTVRDTYERIDFDKFLTVTRLVYLVGYEIANREGRIVVDNPYSTW